MPWNLPWKAEELLAKAEEEHQKDGIPPHTKGSLRPDCAACQRVGAWQDARFAEQRRQQDERFAAHRRLEK